MDGGPFRAPRSQETDRRAISREPAQQQRTQPQPIAEESRAPYAAPTRQTQKKVKSFKKRFIIPGAILLALVLLFAGWIAWTNTRNGLAGIETNKYQAVFFTNGQVYFGKLSQLNDKYLKLTNIYYLQTQSTGSEDANPQSTSSSASGDVKLIKLGQEIHGPEDQMVIARDQVLFYENIKSDGKVGQSISAAQK